MVPGTRPGTAAGPQRLQSKPGGSVGGLHGPAAIFVQASRWVVLSRTKIGAFKWGCNRPQRAQPQQGSRVPPGDTEEPLGTQGVRPGSSGVVAQSDCGAQFFFLHQKVPFYMRSVNKKSS